LSGLNKFLGGSFIKFERVNRQLMHSKE